MGIQTISTYGFVGPYHCPRPHFLIPRCHLSPTHIGTSKLLLRCGFAFEAAKREREREKSAPCTSVQGSATGCNPGAPLWGCTQRVEEEEGGGGGGGEEERQRRRQTEGCITRCSSSSVGPRGNKIGQILQERRPQSSVLGVFSVWGPLESYHSSGGGQGFGERG